MNPIKISQEQDWDSLGNKDAENVFKRTYLSIPKLNQKVFRGHFPWHLQIMVETNLDKYYMYGFSAELNLQLEIENKMQRLIAAYTEIKRIGSYYAQGVTFHDWYLKTRIGEFSAASLLEIDEINSQRGICFEIKYDPNWSRIKRYYADFSKGYFD